jgi:predicted protein tyrosine phosphatase
MIDVRVYSKKDFELAGFSDSNINQWPNDYFICINATGYVDSIPHFKNTHGRLLNLYFDDVEFDQSKYDHEFNLSFDAKACTRQQAVKIKEFLDTIVEESTLHIYCTKGKSRSPAVAKFVEEYKNNQTTNFENYNRHVYNLLKTLC